MQRDERDALAGAIEYFNVRKCCLRNVSITIDFLNTATGHELANFLVTTRTRLWQKLAAMDVREKLVIRITTIQYRGITEFKTHVDP